MNATTGEETAGFGREMPLTLHFQRVRVSGSCTVIKIHPADQRGSKLKVLTETTASGDLNTHHELLNEH